MASEGTKLDVREFETKRDASQHAAAWCAGYLSKTVQHQGKARIIVATGASQFDFLESLLTHSVAWDKVTCFHLDEYVGLSPDHPASFRNYLRERLWNKVKPPMAQVNMLNPDDIQTYSDLLKQGPIDLACIGIGENGHIAFNDPPVADFEDPKLVKIVELDEACRQQQAGEGWFKDLSSTPSHAATLTVPAIMRAQTISVVVPDQRKALAVKDALLGPISTSCPASVLRRHDNCVMWLDVAAASLYDAAKLQS